MTKTPPNLLVTGHTGFIGSALTARLDAEGWAWTGAARANGHDLTEPEGLAGLPATDWVVHLAGSTDILESWENPAKFHRVNYGGTLTALEHCRENKSRMLYISSYMYGVPDSLPIDEGHPVACRNPYSWSKRAGELLCEAYAADFGVPVVILRPFNIYGPGQSAHQLIPHILAQAMTGDTINLADLEPKRDWLWEGDLIEAMLKVLVTPTTGLSMYNIGYGESVSVRQVVDAVLAQVGPREIISRDEVRKNEIPDCVCDARLFSKTFDWQPTTNLEQGIAMLIKITKP